MEIYTGRRFPNLRAGSYRSRMRGAGFDFDEHRAYRPGDDVRRIDWNVTARLNAPFVRETHAERELNVMIAVDVSRSMMLGTGKYSKREIQLLLAGCLVFSSLSDQINTGFLSFSNQVHSFYPPRRNRVQAWRFLEQLWAMEPPAGQTQLLSAVRHLDSHFRQEGVVFVLSDFLTAENLADSRELKILAAKHDIIAVVIEDASELDLPQGNSSVELMDLETGMRRRVGLGESQRARYAAAMQKRREQLVDAFYRVPMDYVFVRSDERAVESLLNLFAVRRRM
jgi:uncharacterized protein (DUF58 family)